MYALIHALRTRQKRIAQLTIGERYSIIVDVPKKTDMVFIAMPFFANLDRLHGWIEDTVIRFGLVPAWLDSPKRGDKSKRARFTRDVHDRFTRERLLELRGARMVIAVCIPEPSSNQPNPNVMYELGLAHAIGKPTIIVGKAESLPADLVEYEIIFYNEEDVDGKEFVRQLGEAIHKKGQTSVYGMVDRYTVGVSVSTAPHFAFRADLWDSFVSIMSLAIKLQNHFDTVQALFLDFLLRDLRTVLSSEPFPGVESAAWLEQWDTYSHYESVHGFEVGAQLQDISSALQSLQADVDLKTYAVVETSKRMYSAIEDAVNKYAVVRQALVEEVEVRRQEYSKEALSMVYSRVSLLRSYAREICSKAVALNVNTIRIITEGGRRKE